MNFTLSLTLAKARKNIRISDKDLADAIGLTAGAISRMKAENSTSTKTIEKIADCFGMTASEFIGLGE